MLRTTHTVLLGNLQKRLTFTGHHTIQPMILTSGIKILVVLGTDQLHSKITLLVADALSWITTTNMDGPLMGDSVRNLAWRYT